MKRNLALLFFAVASLVIFGCAPKKAAQAAAIPRPPRPRRAARSFFFEGDVKIDGTVPEIGQELGAKALVETGTGASCEVIFDEKNAIRISQNAIASLDFSASSRK